MDIIKKQFGFFFPIGLLCGMITAVGFLSQRNCFAMEQHPPFSYYEVIEQRNIFRPKTEEAGLTEEQEIKLQSLSQYAKSDLDKYTLTGIVKIRGKYKATITNKSTKDGHYVGINEIIDGFTVVDIQYDTVTLEEDGETVRLKINTPASRVLSKAPEETEESSTQAVTPQEPVIPGNKEQRRTNIMESIRMGIPNAQRQ